MEDDCGWHGTGMDHTETVHEFSLVVSLTLGMRQCRQ